MKLTKHTADLILTATIALAFWMASPLPGQEPKKDTLTLDDVILVLKARGSATEAAGALQGMVMKLQLDPEYMRLTLASQDAVNAMQAAEIAAAAKCVDGFNKQELKCNPPKPKEVSQK